LARRFNALTAGLDAGKAYFNLHTSSFGGGEVRSVLTPVPEPTTSGLALVGLGLVGAAVRQRRQA
jgi:MYXO-CTERM domain-containing protein